MTDTKKRDGSDSLHELVRLLRSNGVDCSGIVGKSTIHIFKYDATERELRELLGTQMTNYKPGVYGSINSTHHKGIYHQIEVRPNAKINPRKDEEKDSK